MRNPRYCEHGDVIRFKLGVGDPTSPIPETTSEVAVPRRDSPLNDPAPASPSQASPGPAASPASPAPGSPGAASVAGSPGRVVAEEVAAMAIGVAAVSRNHYSAQFL